MVAPAKDQLRTGHWHSRQRDGLSPIPTVYRQRPEHSAQAVVAFGGIGDSVRQIQVVFPELMGFASPSAIDLDPMRVFGIDCGTEITGYGVVETEESARESRLVMKAMGAIRLKKTLSTAERLLQVFRELTAEMERWEPDTVAIEEVFYSVNAKSALKLGQVRGVALLAAASGQLPVAEYAPLKIKSSVVGYGLAKKEQVQFMVARLLGLAEVPEPADAADALAIAICHIHTAQTLSLQGGGR